jgi:hypothetical protein
MEFYSKRMNLVAINKDIKELYCKFIGKVSALILAQSERDWIVQVDICNEVNVARDCGVMHCHIIEPLPLTELVPRFGLFFTPDTYKKISKAQAEAVAMRILHRDLAYDAEIMTETEAQALANRFFDCFDEESAQYYTNGDYYSGGSSHGWNPATSATFDTGILVIDKSRAGCLWVEDED